LKIRLFVLTESMYERDRHTGSQTDGQGMAAKGALAWHSAAKIVIKQQKLMLKTS